MKSTDVIAVIVLFIGVLSYILGVRDAPEREGEL